MTDLRVGVKAPVKDTPRVYDLEFDYDSSRLFLKTSQNNWNAVRHQLGQMLADGRPTLPVHRMHADVPGLSMFELYSDRVGYGGVFLSSDFTPPEGEIIWQYDLHRHFHNSDEYLHFRDAYNVLKSLHLLLKLFGGIEAESTDMQQLIHLSITAMSPACSQPAHGLNTAVYPSFSQAMRLDAVEYEAVAKQAVSRIWAITHDHLRHLDFGAGYKVMVKEKSTTIVVPGQASSLFTADNAEGQLLESTNFDGPYQLLAAVGAITAMCQLCRLEY